MNVALNVEQLECRDTPSAVNGLTNALAHVPVDHGQGAAHVQINLTQAQANEAAGLHGAGLHTDLVILP